MNYLSPSLLAADFGKLREELEKIAKDNNYTLTNNVDRIINAKLRFFGEDIRLKNL